MAAPDPTGLPSLRRPPRRRPGDPAAAAAPYVCTRHAYWIGPPDAGQPPTPLGWPLADIVRAQRRHLRLVRRHGSAAAYDAVLTGFLICGHGWGEDPRTPVDAWHRWTLRAQVLIPPGAGLGEFSVSRLFAVLYPEAVDIAALIAAPGWRALAGGDTEQRQRFLVEIGARLGRPDYRPPEGGDAITHWITYDSWRPPSRPHKIYPDTSEHGSTRLRQTGSQTTDRQQRSAMWFSVNRRGGTAVLHHRHIRPVLIRDWSRPMDGIAAAIWASQTTTHPVEDSPSRASSERRGDPGHRRRPRMMQPAWLSRRIPRRWRRVPAANR